MEARGLWPQNGPSATTISTRTGITEPVRGSVDLEPGRHSIVARCWIVIDGWGLKPLNLPVDADGRLRFSTFAYTYDLLIKTTVDARER